MTLKSSANRTWTRPALQAIRLLLFLAVTVSLQSSASAQTTDLTVSFAPGAGTFVGSETVTLSVRAGAVIHYTLDGSLPTSVSPVYREAIRLDRSTRLRAIALADDAATRAGAGNAVPEAWREGPVASETYLRVDPDAADFTSHLPIILVHTFESRALDAYGSEHVPAALLVLEPHEGTSHVVGRAVLDARIGIHVRGESSRNFPKKQYAVELRADGNDSDSGQPLLGLPSHADWVMSDPVAYDRSLIRNAVAYALSNRIGRYASRTRFAEVFLVDGDGDVSAANFQGLFTVIEKIDRDANRVSVARLPASANSLPAMTGGFILSIDKGQADFAAGGRWFQFVYPDAEEMARPERASQRDFIRGVVDGFVAAASAPDFRHPATGQHYEEFIDVDAWIDHHIINVLTKNADGMRYSTYFHKDRGGRLAAGPVWDFDRSLGTPYDARATDPGEWTSAWSRGGQNFAEGWWALLFRDPAFTSRYRTRFKALLDGEFSADSLDGLVDGLAAEVGAAADRNFRRWPQTPPMNNSYTSEISQLKDFLRRRVAWLKTQLDTL
jgi:hypothetical protein